MGALHRILWVLDKIFHFKEAHAHCDIPCGIYDPHTAQIAAHTVLRMDTLIADIMKEGGVSADDRNKLARCIVVKEQYAEQVKHEVRIIWGDYAKPDMVTPELNKLVFDIMKAASKAKQDTNIDSAKDLLAKVEQFTKWFWKTKNVPTVKAKSFSPLEEGMIYPKV